MPRKRRNSRAFPTSVETYEPRTLLTTLHPAPVEVASMDGMGNNPHYQDWGSVGVELLRMADADYADGLSKPAGSDRPSAREISNGVADAPSSITNNRHFTDILWMWGQFLDHDIDITEGSHDPVESYHIPVPQGDPFFDPFNTGLQEIHLNRSAFVMDDDGVRQQINQITAFIDGSVVYGSNDVRAAALRTGSGGLLKTSSGDLLPFNTTGLPNAGGPSPNLFLAGDVRANENAALSAMHTLWVREHNRIATEIAADHPGLNDEEIYQQARAIVRAELQVITYNEFLPALLGAGALSPYAGYNPEVNPGIANEFSTAAYRFGHSLLSPTLSRLDADGSVADEGNLPLRDAFFRPDQLALHGIDSILRGATVQLAQELDNQIVDDVRNFLFGPPGAGGFDLASLNIQRGRDHGLSSYNDTREALGLGRVSSFSEISSDPAVVANLMSVYDSVDDIDLWVGGLAEDHVYASSMGETFQTIIVDQFERLRDGDRFWYQNNIYSSRQLRELEATTLADVIERNSGISNLQKNVFFAPSVLHVDLSARDGSQIKVHERNGRLMVLDDLSRVIASGSLAEIDRLVLVGSDDQPDQFKIYAMPEGSLADGIQILAGASGGDVLKIVGTNNRDEILVSADTVSVNGLVIHFEEVDQIGIHSKKGRDDIQIEDDVEIPVFLYHDHGHHYGQKDDVDAIFVSDDLFDSLT